ncbi:MGMT family protein, partial [Paracraurococcus sp. LOR1-02]
AHPPRHLECSGSCCSSPSRFPVGQSGVQGNRGQLIPCHRVLAAGGKIGGFSAPGGSASKAHMLELEGIRRVDQPEPVQLAFRF